jgi:ascorbate-specific PTS system EIIC-type component UlaA
MTDIEGMLSTVVGLGITVAGAGMVMNQMNNLVPKQQQMKKKKVQHNHQGFFNYGHLQSL